MVRLPNNIQKSRSLEQLSSGEYRKLAIALAFSFADVTSRRGRLRCNLMILDEVIYFNINVMVVFTIGDV